MSSKYYTFINLPFKSFELTKFKCYLCGKVWLGKELDT